MPALRDPWPDHLWEIPDELLNEIPNKPLYEIFMITSSVRNSCPANLLNLSTSMIVFPTQPASQSQISRPEKYFLRTHCYKDILGSTIYFMIDSLTCLASLKEIAIHFYKKYRRDFSDQLLYKNCFYERCFVGLSVRDHRSFSLRFMRYFRSPPLWSIPGQLHYDKFAKLAWFSKIVFPIR